MRHRRIGLAVLLTLGLLSCGGLAVAQDTSWKPPEPSPESQDWIRLTSGEWLRGEIQVFLNDKLEFDSQELDELTLDWKDIAELRSPRILTYTFDKRRTATGTARMRADTLAIRTDLGPRAFLRSDLLTITEGALSEWNLWSAKISLGLIARAGNTDQEDLNTLVFLRRQAPRLRLGIEYKGNFSNTNDVQTVNSHRGDARFDYLVSRGFFVTPFSGELYSDKFQNINLRGTAGAGIGVFLFRKSDREWYVQLGGGYQHTRFVSVEPGESMEEQSGTILPSTALELDITGSLEFSCEYSAQVTIPDTKGTVHHALALFSFEITSILDLDLSLTWDRVENPKADAESNVPQRDDYRLSVGLGLDF
jgi:putative salt-induced outer membrane protein YdiY